MTDNELAACVEPLAALLTTRNGRLATAESCTGGWVAKVCTDRPGSSAWFDRGFVTYSDAAKIDLLGVDADLVVRCGAVSAEVAAAMAAGAIARSGAADYALAITGIAGPDGGSPAKPVGTVWFGWAGGGRDPTTRRLVFDGDREAVRRAAVAAALQGLIARLESGGC